MNPIDDAMPCQDGNSCDSRRRRSSGLHRNAIAFACLTPVVVAGCGFGSPASRSSASVEIIRGKDSAGATIELEKWGDDLIRARVIDIVLGTGEAEIISDENGNIEFTIDFPGGAAITYGGRQAYAEEPNEVMFSGTWRQHPGGVFGPDVGTWEAPTPPDHES